MKARTTPLLAASAFWLPPEGRWQTIQATAKLAGVEKGGGTFRSAKTSCRNRRMHRDFSLSAANGDLSGLGGGERNSAKPKARCGPSDGARASHWAGVRWRVQRNTDSFRADLHSDLKADFVPVRKDIATATRASAKTILAKPNRRSVGETELHPPFNMTDWGGENLRPDVRWKFEMPPVNNANYGWIQHFIHHLSPVGVAGFVLANGSMASKQSGEGEIREGHTQIPQGCPDSP